MTIVPPSAKIPSVWLIVPVHPISFPPNEYSIRTAPPEGVAAKAGVKVLNGSVAIPVSILREKLIKIGAKVVIHARYVTFQMAEAAISRQLFETILRRISRLGPVSSVPI